MTRFSTRKIVLLVLFLFLALALVAAARFPAETALARFGPTALQVDGVEGTIWHGSAEKVQYGDTPALTAVTWQIRPHSLVERLPAWDVTFDYRNGTGSGVIQADRQGRLELSETVFDTPATDVGEWIDLPWLQFGGDIRVEVDHAQLYAGSLQRLTGSLHWPSATVTQPLRFPLGDIQGRIAPAEGSGGHRGALNAEGGFIQIQGDGWLRENGEYELEFRLLPAADAPPEVRFLLDAIGRRDGNAYRLNRKGQID